MSITRKWSFARAEIIDSESVCWIAECRSGTGTWVIREIDDASVKIDEAQDLGDSLPLVIVGSMFDFAEGTDMLLVMTAEQRSALGMSDETYQALNVALGLDNARNENPTSDVDVRTSLVALRRRVETLEAKS